MVFRSRAPVRFDFAGGWTDVALFCQETKGKVVNAALDIYAYATLCPNPAQKGAVPYTDGKITIRSTDFDVYVEARDIRKIEYDGNADLVKAAIRRYSSKQGFELITRSDAPPGSGLGTSAAMGVALISVINAYNDRHMLPYEMAEAASLIEREELGIRGGKQDQYASAMGGFQFMEFSGEDVKTSRLNLREDVVLELEKNLVLCYTGKSRLSGDIHKNVTEAFQRGDPDTVGAIERLKGIAEEMKVCLVKGDLDSFGRLLDENWGCQKPLHPSVTNEEIEELFAIAYRSGAVGGKAGGAGGGGCLMFYCGSDREHRVRRALEKTGVTIIDFSSVKPLPLVVVRVAVLP